MRSRRLTEAGASDRRMRVARSETTATDAEAGGRSGLHEGRMPESASMMGVSDRDERQRSKPGTGHSTPLGPTACLFGQSPLQITDRLSGMLGPPLDSAPGQ